MIKFFRKIRQRMLTENKFGKYLIYAIGEILLVVIGILIALQVNNWNSQSNERDKQIVILTEMNRNLKINVNLFSEEIDKQDSIIQIIDIFLNQIKNNIPYPDSMGHKYASIAWNEDFNYANSAFETLKTTGFYLISSDSLREKIINIFNVRYLKSYDVINNVSMAEYVGLNKLYLRHIEYDKQGKVIINDFDSLKKDKEFTNMLSARRVWKSDLITIYKTLIEESKQLSRMIYRELDELKK